MKNQLFAPTITWVALPSIFKTIRKFLTFLKKPVHKQIATVPKQFRLQVLFQLILTDVFVKIVLLVAVGYLYHLLEINLQQWNLSAILDNKPFYLVILLVAVYGPLKAELLFRLPLVYSRRFLLLALAIFLVAYAPLIMKETQLGLIHYTGGAIIIFGTAMALLLSPHMHACIRHPWKKDYAALFYLFSLLFAIQHLVNYPYINLPVFMLPVLVLLQWIEGLFLGYTRLHLGFKWSIAQHIFNKTLLLIVFFSFYSST